MEQITLTNLDRRFKFGKDRGKVGNGKIKRLEAANKKSSTKPFDCKRKSRRHTYTNALSDLLVEQINETGTDPEYMVSFRNRPLVGKVFTGIIIKHIYNKSNESGVGLRLLASMENHHADMAHISREVGAINEKLAMIADPKLSDVDKAHLDKASLEAAKEEYLKQNKAIYDEVIKKQLLASKISKMTRSYPVISKASILLRVTEIVERDKEFGSYTCIAIPA